MSNYTEVNLTKTLEDNFARYAGMVIQDRAIVDVRDGLKPAARQLTYAQYIDKLTYDKPFNLLLLECLISMFMETQVLIQL